MYIFDIKEWNSCRKLCYFQYEYVHIVALTCKHFQTDILCALIVAYFMYYIKFIENVLAPNYRYDLTREGGEKNKNTRHYVKLVNMNVI